MSSEGAIAAETVESAEGAIAEPIESAEGVTSQSAESPLETLSEQIAEDICEDRLELPGFPEAVLRVQRTMQSPDVSAEEVVRVLSSEPALAARALQIANSVQFRRGGPEVTDLRTAVSRLGFNLVRSIAVAYAIHQLRLRETYSAAAKAEIEAIWRCSVQVAAASYVLAKHGVTGINADQALLAGLLHVIGRLYIVMRAEGIGGAADADLARAAEAYQGEIGRMILASWGLPEPLQHAVEHQDALDYAASNVTVTDVLIAAKYLMTHSGDEEVICTVLDRIAESSDSHPAEVLEEHASELRTLTSSFLD